jgi:RNA polymerase sigma-70 factor, ECF subfamily
MVAMTLQTNFLAQTRLSDDGALLAAITARDAAAFETLMKRHYAIVYRVVWRMMPGEADAEDVTQEAFLKIWNQPSLLREVSALRSFLIRTACNMALDRLKSYGARKTELTETLADHAPLANAMHERKRIAERIDQAIAKLPERQRLALTLVSFEQMSQQAAADILETSVDALESLLARARRALKEDLAEEWRDLLEGLAE